ncbi:MAG: hypothetical protein KDD82_13610, partial [Planctomycetes bacterium]|nr:hypothetical protein [Planctomycetota bacterium]
RLFAGELEFDQLDDERARLRAELRERLARYLTPAQLERVPYPRLVEGPPPSPSAWIEGGFTWMPSAALRGRGRVELRQTAAEVQLSVPLTRPLTLSFGVRGASRRVDFEDAFELDPVSGDPFEQLTSGRVTVGAQLRLGPVFAIASTNVQVALEDGASFEDAITFGGLLGVSYAFTPNFALGLGALVRSRLEENVQVIPLPLIRFNVELSAWWRLTVGAPEGVQLIFSPDPSFVAQLGIGFRGGIAQDVRLDDRGFAPEGVARSRRIPVQLQLRWSPLERLTLGLDAGVFLWQKVQIDDRRGNDLTEDRTEPTPFGGLSLRVSF